MTAVQLRGQLGNTNKGYNGNSIDEGVFLFICVIRGSGLRIKPQNCRKGFTAEKKWERFQNSRKGYSMTISKLEMGMKGKGKESFQSLPTFASK